MKIHTVVVTYNRLELTKRAIASYLETVTVPYSLAVVDNASTDGTQDWLLHDFDHGFHLLSKNRYPGFACNLGWGGAPANATHLHRADNDFIFLPGWCETLAASFRNKKVGQVGLRTDDEERIPPFSPPANVGGNCAIRRELWDKGLRYNETPWPSLPAGHSEDTYLSPAVEKMGYLWKRVKKPCIQSIATEDPEDSYYQQSWADRRIHQ